MSKATTLQLISDLSGGQADATMVERLYRDVVFDLGRAEWLTQVTLVSAVEGTPVYTLPSAVIDPIAIFYDDTMLYEAKLGEVEWTDGPNWRDKPGHPLAYLTESESLRSFRLFPKPDASSKDFIFLFGAPFGLDFPEYSVAVIHTENRDDLPTWLELPVALRVLAYEFERESDHKDETYADLCRNLSTVLFGMVA